MTQTRTASRTFAALTPACDQSWAGEDGEAMPCPSDAVLVVISRFTGTHHMCGAHANGFPSAAKYAI